MFRLFSEYSSRPKIMLSVTNTQFVGGQDEYSITMLIQTSVNSNQITIPLVLICTGKLTRSTRNPANSNLIFIPLEGLVREVILHLYHYAAKITTKNALLKVFYFVTMAL